MSKTLREGKTLNQLPQKWMEHPPAKKQGYEKQTYLHVGDKIFHKKFKSWGCGIVIEARTSSVPGGLFYVRIQFQDGKKRVFNNSLDNVCCCYYTGITLLNRVKL